MNHKYLVTGGCSFSESSDPWAYELGINHYNVSNLARGSCGNEFIRRQVIFKVSELLKKGIPSNEILVGVQWTGIARIDLFVSEEEVATENKFHTDFKIDNIGHETHPANSGSLEWNWNFDKHDYGWIHSGGGDNFVKEWGAETFEGRYFQKYFKYFMTHNQGWSNFLYNVLMLQWFCKSNNISLFNFTGWNLIDNDGGDNYIDNNVEKFPESRHLWDMIDKHNFIFVESGICNIKKEEITGKKSPYGGMWQYLTEHNGINLDNDHPSEDGQSMWGNFLKDELIKRKII